MLICELEQILKQKLKATDDDFLPADEYMRQWNYRYDFNDSLRSASIILNESNRSF